MLDEVSGFLREQYYDRGKYGVVVDTSVLDRPNNTVGVRIDVVEGDRAKIRQVNLVGNQAFEEKDIREGFRARYRELVVVDTTGRSLLERGT